MKSGLRMRPVYHWKPHRIEAHIKLCVLALLLERGDALIRQTTEARHDVSALLKELGVPLPPRLHALEGASVAPCA